MVTFDEFKKFYYKFPRRDNKFYYQQFPEGNQSTIRNYKYRCGLAEKTTATRDATLNKSLKQKSIPPQNTPSTEDISRILASIENPVAYTTAHIFKQMVESKEYRWAQLFVSVLEKTNKLDYETIREQEWLNQAKSMSMSELVEKVAKRESISRSTLRRLDDLGDTSQYENI